MSDFLERAECAIQQSHLLPPRQKVLVAVSGGADSMVLLHVLHSLARKYRWRLSVAHFNHRLRGRASDADEKRVRQAAAKLRLPIFAESGDVKAFAKRSRMSLEMAARKLRHEFFARVARAQKINTIALAHHSGDQVELFFLRWLRGAGGGALAGMPPRAPSPVDKKITLIRPLLGFTKAEIQACARADGIAYREDASNRSNQHLRNRIRNELIPLLEKKYQPGLVRNVLRTMEITGAESALAASMARHWRQKGAATPHDLAALPTAIQRQVLHQQLIEQGVPPDFELVEALRTASKKWVSVGAGLSVARDASGVISLRRSPGADFDAGELEIKFSGRTGHAEFGGREFNWSLIKISGPCQPPSHHPNTELFDADTIGGEIILRHWRAGDRFQPIGLASPVKLQDLFVNAKIPAARRRHLVVAVTKPGVIFWVEALRIGELFKLTPKTGRQLLWHFSSDSL